MNKYSSLFSQMLALFPRLEFEKLVRQTGAEYAAKGFSSWGHFVAMLFCQLGQAHSLREICNGLASCFGKLKHLGISSAPKRSTLAYANEHRSWELYQRTFYELLSRCRGEFIGRTKFRFKNKLMSFDASVIDLCASLFDWAKFRRTKGAVKLHLLLDHEGYLPQYAHITEGKVHEVNILKKLRFSPGTIVAFDRGLVDYKLFGDWTAEGVYFVTRLKDNADFRVVKKLPVPANRNILSDEIIEFTGFYAHRDCPHLLRKIEVFDKENEEVIVLLTNHLSFGTTTISAIYKDRWQIGVSNEGRMIQPVEVRSRPKDSRPCSLGGAVEREQDGEALRQHSLKGGCATLQVVTCSERGCSLVTRKIRWPSRSICVRRQQEVTV